MHIPGGRERAGGWVVELGFVRDNVSRRVPAGHQHLAVLECRGRKHEPTNGHATGGTPRALRLRPGRGSREHQCGNDNRDPRFEWGPADAHHLFRRLIVVSEGSNCGCELDLIFHNSFSLVRVIGLLVCYSLMYCVKFLVPLRGKLAPPR